MRRLLLLPVLVLACSRETPAPPAASTAPPDTTPAPAQAAPRQAATAPSYDDAVVWLKTVKHFTFTLEESGTRVDGEMTRPRVGAEQVRFRAAGVEWLGEPSAQGLVWKVRRGGSWTEAAPPDFANRFYQRVTLGLDPRKKEGSAQLASSGGGSAVYQFTDANSGEPWQVRVGPGPVVERITIGRSVDLRIRP